ncbi:HAD family hydrolase [Mesorhizobium captivum]|uniref:HAD family hydrolase n=1 Tax=Mesorhizobium captivum TaxID=3072319 RepID=UPI002A24E13C|nr:HAD family hydrolase [Mesorhizobium sp. VK23E]MDX8516418.1 HAD family hydrolase [Mesorhizobium sp. VK23E]
MDSLIFARARCKTAVPRLFVCDVDRTLLTHDHVLLPSVSAAARSLRSVKLPLVLASARSPVGLERVHAEVGASDTVCCFNGAWIGMLSSRITLKEKRIDREAALEAMTSVHDLGGSPIWFDLETCFVLRPDESVARRRTNVTGDDLQLVDTPTEAPRAPFKLLATFPEETLEASVSLLSSRFSGLLTVVQSGPNLVELVAKGVQKDVAAAFIAAEFGLDAIDVAAAGDSDNDLGLLCWAGLAITVSNAKPHVQAVADIVAPSCDIGGLAFAFEWMVESLSRSSLC